MSTAAEAGGTGGPRGWEAGHGTIGFCYMGADLGERVPNMRNIKRS